MFVERIEHSLNKLTLGDFNPGIDGTRFIYICSTYAAVMILTALYTNLKFNC